MATPEDIRSWALVLDAEGIPYDITTTDNGPSLVVDAEDAVRAGAVLNAYYDENRDRLVARTAPVEDRSATGRHDTPWAVASALVVVTALAMFHVFVIRADDTGAWFAAGSGDSSLIRAGDWWRTVTALTIHADLGHIASNVASGLLLFALVFAALGPGVGGLAVLVAGAIGNLVNAWIHADGHVAVGASTAIMGALGILAGMALARGAGPVGQRHWGWAPLTAAVMLLVLTGLGPSTDILAHLLGFLAGLPVGVLAARAALPRRAWPTQSALGMTAVLVIVACWVIAFAHV